jgi:hypothetical protein
VTLARPPFEKGQPYLVVRTVKQVGWKFETVARNECIQICSEIQNLRVRMFVEPAAAITEFTPKKRTVNHWDAYPEGATSEYQDNFPIVHIESGTRIATGYTSIVVIGTVNLSISLN